MSIHLLKVITTSQSVIPGSINRDEDFFVAYSDFSQVYEIILKPNCWTDNRIYVYQTVYQFLESNKKHLEKISKCLI
jgi:hypothetical protein